MLNHLFGPSASPSAFQRSSRLRLVEAIKASREEARQNILMGNYRFRLSDMLPNSWFYKLRDMGIRRRNQKKEPTSASPTLPQQILLHSHPRKSNHFTRELAASREFVNSPADIINFAAEPPRKSSKGKPRRKSTAKTSPRLVVTSSSVPSGCSCGRAVESDGPSLRLPSPPSVYSVERESSHQPELGSDPTLLSQCSFDGLACGCHTNPEAKAIIIEEEQKSPAKNFNDSDELKSLAQIELPPIITKPSMPEETDVDGSLCPSVTITKKDKSFARELRNSPSRRFVMNSPGPKLRMNSPRVSSKRFGQVSRRKSVSSSSKRSLTDSLAIVKSSNDPQRDFRESMVEMIVEHKISASTELEDLLACYLSLNTDEYHDTIIKVFKQIWFDMTDIGVA